MNKLVVTAERYISFFTHFLPIFTPLFPWIVKHESKISGREMNYSLSNRLFVLNTFVYSFFIVAMMNGDYSFALLFPMLDILSSSFMNLFLWYLMARLPVSKCKCLPFFFATYHIKFAISYCMILLTNSQNSEWSEENFLCLLIPLSYLMTIPYFVEYVSENF